MFSSQSEVRASIFEAPKASGNLRRNSVRGASLVSASRVIGISLRFGSTAVLARILSQHDYGLVAMTSVVSGFFWIFMDIGLSAATIQREEISHRQISTLFWINVFLGFVVAAVVSGIAPLVASFYGQPEVAGIMQIFALAFFIGGFTVQHQALLQRHMRFKEIAINDITSAILGVLTAITMAFAGFGYWSLVGMPIATAISKLVGVWFNLGWIPGLPSRNSNVRQMLRFGSDIFGFAMVNYLARQADTILIGHSYGPKPLANYEKAYSLLLLPIGQINAPLASIASPALARLKTDEPRFRKFFLSLIQIVSSLGIPLVVGIAIFANEIVAIWLGRDWGAAVSIFRCLALAALIGGLSNPLGWLQISLGQTRKYRNLGIANTAIIVISFFIGLPYGPKGVATAYSIAMGLIFVPFWWLALKGSPVKLLSAFGTMVPSVVSCLIAAAPAIFVRQMQIGGMSAWVSSIAAGIIYFSVYAVLLLVVFRKWSFFLEILKELKSAKR